MHSNIVNAAIQLIPVVQDRHPYDWVDEAIEVIRQSGIKNETGAFATVVEGTYAEVMAVVHQVNEHLLQRGCTEWITNVQIQIRSTGDITVNDKTCKFLPGR
jgi:uncharacterized protein (TIGR00106 family)